MRLLGSGYVVTETTFAGTTAGAGGASTGSGTYAPGKGFKIQKVVAFCGGSTVAANSSGGIQLTVGQSSGATESTYVVLPFPKYADASSAASAAPMSVELEGLNIQCNWFEARTNEAASGGWGIFVMGE